MFNFVKMERFDVTCRPLGIMPLISSLTAAATKVEGSWVAWESLGRSVCLLHLWACWLPSPDTCGQEMAAGRFPDGAAWSRLARQLHWVHRQRRPFAAQHLIGAACKHCLDPCSSTPSLLLHGICLWVHSGLIRLMLVLGPISKYWRTPFLFAPTPTTQSCDQGGVYLRKACCKWPIGHHNNHFADLDFDIASTFMLVWPFQLNSDDRARSK